MGGGQDPVRALELNVWAMLSFLRSELGLGEWMSPGMPHLWDVLKEGAQAEPPGGGESGQQQGAAHDQGPEQQSTDSAPKYEQEIMVGFDGLYHKLGLQAPVSSKA